MERLNDLRRSSCAFCCAFSKPTMLRLVLLTRSSKGSAATSSLLLFVETAFSTVAAAAVAVGPETLTEGGERSRSSSSKMREDFRTIERRVRSAKESVWRGFERLRGDGEALSMVSRIWSARSCVGDISCPGSEIGSGSCTGFVFRGGSFLGLALGIGGIGLYAVGSAGKSNRSMS